VEHVERASRRRPGSGAAGADVHTYGRPAGLGTGLCAGGAAAVLDAADDGYATYLETINDLADEHDAAEVAAAILKLYAEETGRTTTPEQQEDDIATFAAAAPPARGPRGEAGMVRLFINVGRNQGARPQDFVGAIANEAGIPGRAIGAIDIFDDYAFVDVPREFVDRVLAAMRGAKIKGRPVNVEVAPPRRYERSDRTDRGGSPRFRTRREG
jgi:hypothetical protein